MITPEQFASAMGCRNCGALALMKQERDYGTGITTIWECKKCGWSLERYEPQVKA